MGNRQRMAVLAAAVLIPVALAVAVTGTRASVGGLEHNCGSPMSPASLGTMGVVFDDACGTARRDRGLVALALGAAGVGAAAVALWIPRQRPESS